MTFDIPAAVKSVGEAIKSIADSFKVSKEHQSETQLVKDKKRLKKATNTAQDIFRITDEYKHLLPEDVLKDYNELRKKFDNED